MMTILNEELWKTLENLTNDQFKLFKWFLKQDDTAGGFVAIPEAQLEQADRQDAVDLMVQRYGGPRALCRTVTTLEKISRNDLTQHLLSISSRTKDPPHNQKNLNSEYETKKAELRETQAEITRMMQQRQKKLQELKRSAELSRTCADRQSHQSRQVFTALLQTLHSILDNLLQEIEETQQTTQRQAEGLIQELEQEMCELTERSAEVEQLLGVDDHLQFLQGYANQNPALPTKDWTDVSIQPPSYGRRVGSAVNQLKEEVSKGSEELIAEAKLNRVQQFAVDVSLDPDTANPWLVLSDDGKRVHCGEEKLNLPDNPGRFSCAINVLGKQSFSSGRVYYEVEVEGKTSWDLGVVTESVSRKGRVHAKPENGYWTMCLRDSTQYKAAAVRLRVRRPPKKVGVFVDCEGGSVSFFDVHSANVLHSFSGCSFTERLVPIFSPGLCGGGNCTPLIITHGQSI